MCKGILGAIFGHKFKPRYSQGKPTLSNIKADAITINHMAEIIEASKPKSYFYDVCERCGEIIKS